MIAMTAVAVAGANCECQQYRAPEYSFQKAGIRVIPCVLLKHLLKILSEDSWETITKDSQTNIKNFS